MTSKIRIFISSTMKDLANERDAAVRKISDLNFEPVNAESWLPSGSKSWDKICQELQSSHIFVLILGERYGWVPDRGPGADDGLSVTHMEFNAARRMKVPILPFVKRLDYEGPRETQDAKKRDKFRKEIGRWDTGHFVSEFDLASDLSAKTGAALVDVLCESYLSEQVRKRAQVATPILLEPAKREAPPPALEGELTNAVHDRRAILLAGAGMSLNAGYPSALALTELLIAKIGEDRDRGSGASLSGGLPEVAEYFKMAYGRATLNTVVQHALDTPQLVQPTEAHMLSVQLFRTVLTTNIDCLFELACGYMGSHYVVFTGDAPVPENNDQVTVIKLNGSITDPESLVLTTRDLWRVQNTKPRLWQSLARLMDTQTLVVVGHSLSDISTSTLLDTRRRHVPGCFVAPTIGSSDELRLRRWGLKAVESDADQFFRVLGAMIGVAV